jgi:hypothetical protein
VPSQGFHSFRRLLRSNAQYFGISAATVKFSRIASNLQPSILGGCSDPEKPLNQGDYVMGQNRTVRLTTRSVIVAAALILAGPLLAVGATGTASAACYNPNSDLPPGWNPGIPPCPMEKVLVNCEWGEAYGPICPGDCRHDLQGGIIDPPDPACRLEQRLVYMSPDGVYMGLVEGQSRLPSKAAAPPSVASNPVNVSPAAEQQFINDLAAIEITPTSTPKNLANTGSTICEYLTDAYRQTGSSMAGPGLKNGAASELRRGNSTITWEQAQAWVQAAVDDTCPDRVTGMHLQ